MIQRSQVTSIYSNTQKTENFKLYFKLRPVILNDREDNMWQFYVKD